MEASTQGVGLHGVGVRLKGLVRFSDSQGMTIYVFKIYSRGMAYVYRNVAVLMEQIVFFTWKDTISCA